MSKSRTLPPVQPLQTRSRAEIGRENVRKRWGWPPRIVRLDDPSLSPEARRLIIALVEAAKAAPADDSGNPA